MNHTIQNASYVTARCIRFTQYLTSSLKVVAFTLPTSNLRNAVLTSTFRFVFDRPGTLQARAHQGLTPGRLRLARGVAFAIGISLSIPMASADSGSIDAIHSLRQLADIQLTEKQEACHNDIVFRESSFRADARNGSHHGYYQGRTTYLIGKPDDVQFYWYWTYVSSRYGVTEYDEPDYCKALHHQRVKGWQ